MLYTENDNMHPVWCGRIVPPIWYLGWTIFLFRNERLFSTIFAQVCLIIFRTLYLLSENSRLYFIYPSVVCVIDIVLCVLFYDVSLIWIPHLVVCIACNTFCSMFEHIRSDSERTELHLPPVVQPPEQQQEYDDLQSVFDMNLSHIINNSTTDDCGICMDNERQLYPLKRCHHLFCVLCIRRWAQESNACPVCRGPIR